MSPQNKSREKLLIRQIEGETWEVWAVTRDQARLVNVCNTPGDAQFFPHSMLALPLRQSFAIPLWLATTDKALMREMIFLQLERRGFSNARSAGEAVFDYRILKSVENKTLALAVSLPGALPEQFCLDLHNYEPSARTHLFPADEFILWREGDRLALAVTQGSDLVYFQSLGDGNFTEAVLKELQCIRLELEAEDVIGQLEGITLWAEFSLQELSMVEEAMDLRVTSGKRPAPVIPGELLDLVPTSIRQNQHVTKTQEFKKSLMTATMGIYLLILLFLLIRVGWFHLKCRQIEAELSGHKLVVTELQETAHRWDLLDPAVNPESYPVEQLLRCARLLPPEGVRFTLFKTTAGKIFIQGEAKNAPAAFKFAEELKQNKDLGDYRWQMPQPRLLANDNAEFQIEGAQYSEKNQ